MQQPVPARPGRETVEQGADRHRPVSIFDVAKAAGVSHQTVSRVVNGSPKVRKATRDRVLEVIDELGYKPNRLARALAGGVVRSVTVLTSDTTLYGASLTLRGIEEAARAAEFTVAISVLDEHAPPTPQDVANRLARPGEPVLVIAFDALGERAWRTLPAEFPAAAVVERPQDGRRGSRPEAWLDDRAAAAQATRCLLGLGHRTVHHMAIPSSTARVGQRAQGWRDALTGAGRPVPEPLEGGWTPRSGYLAARSLVGDPEVTAVLCGNDELALGVLRAAREAGRDVPGDLSVAGFDDAPYAGYTHPALTTVRLDFEGLGRGAFGMLHRLLDPDNAPAPPLWAEPELIVRESTGPAPGRAHH
ncbi:LacI family transcriptional regulator [Streptomyces sp. NBC_00631]|uniref:LacI family DNA-binding transcriptional regulator n=1 Tax=Streptomyces sp. NBC_00631 TaxID=2975793 RepID=UPI0030DF6F9C